MMMVSIVDAVLMIDIPILRYMVLTCKNVSMIMIMITTVNVAYNVMTNEIVTVNHGLSYYCLLYLKRCHGNETLVFI